MGRRQEPDVLFADAFVDRLAVRLASIAIDVVLTGDTVVLHGPRIDAELVLHERTRWEPDGMTRVADAIVLTWHGVEVDVLLLEDIAPSGARRLLQLADETADRVRRQVVTAEHGQEIACNARDETVPTRDEVHGLLERVRLVADQSAAAALRRIVRDYRSYDPTVYCVAVAQVGSFADPSLEAPLLAALADQAYGCQAWAAMGCAKLGCRAAIPMLMQLLEHDDEYVREQAVTALGVLGDETVVVAVAPRLHDSSEWMRQRAATALAEIGGEAALAALWNELEHRRHRRIGYVASALARFAPGVVPRLIAASADHDPDRRYWAVVALGSTGDERAVPSLTRLLEDSGTTTFDGTVAAAARRSLRTLRRVQSAGHERR